MQATISAPSVTGTITGASLTGSVGGASISGTISGAALQGSLSTASMSGAITSAALSGQLAIQSGTSTFAGEYTSTPTTSAQTFATAGKRMASDFVVEAIPSNYGLITWDGSKLTVT